MGAGRQVPGRVRAHAALAEDEELDGTERACDTLLMCIVTVMNHGLRNGGGVGDILRKPSKDVSTPPAPRPSLPSGTARPAAGSLSLSSSPVSPPFPDFLLVKASYVVAEPPRPTPPSAQTPCQLPADALGRDLGGPAWPRPEGGKAGRRESAEGGPQATVLPL